MLNRSRESRALLCGLADGLCEVGKESGRIRKIALELILEAVHSLWAIRSLSIGDRKSEPLPTKVTDISRTLAKTSWKFVFWTNFNLQNLPAMAVRAFWKTERFGSIFIRAIVKIEFLPVAKSRFGPWASVPRKVACKPTNSCSRRFVYIAI